MTQRSPYSFSHVEVVRIGQWPSQITDTDPLSILLIISRRRPLLLLRLSNLADNDSSQAHLSLQLATDCFVVP